MKITTMEDFIKIDKGFDGRIGEDKEEIIVLEYTKLLVSLIQNAPTIKYKERTTDVFTTRHPNIGIKIIKKYLDITGYFNEFLLYFITDSVMIELLNDKELVYVLPSQNPYAFSKRLNVHKSTRFFLDNQISSKAKMCLYSANFSEDLMDSYIKFGIINKESYELLDSDQLQIFNMLMSTSFGKVNCTSGLFWINLSIFIDVYGFDYVKKPLQLALCSFENYSSRAIIYDLRSSLYTANEAIPNVKNHIKEIFECIFISIEGRHTKTISNYLEIFKNNWLSGTFIDSGYNIENHIHEFSKRSKRMRRILMELKLK